MSAPPARPPSPPSLAEAVWLRDAGTQAVFRAIADAGFSARVVGGAVRNALIGTPVKDIDFATTARPQEVIALAAAAGLKSAPTGIDHGTVTVIVGHVPFEVTTLREDVETFGRHARVAFTQDWVADAQRRDFTINALYCDAEGVVFDPLEGYRDLVRRRVRFIGDPSARIREDTLRILRFFRFHAEYGREELDRPSLAACIREKEGLRQLSGERIRAELMRLLAAPGAASCLSAMAASGIADVVLGQPPRIDDFGRLVALEAALGSPPDSVLRLAALILPTRDPAHLRDRLRLSSAELQRLTALSRGIAGLAPSMPETAAKAAIYRHGTAAVRDAVRLTWARCGDAEDDAAWHALASLADNWQPPVLPVRGADLIARGLAPGPQIGRTLATFENWWITAGFPMDEALIENALSWTLALPPD
jgi:poly(A) polymerase